MKLRIGRREIDQIIRVSENERELAALGMIEKGAEFPRAASGRANHCMLFFTKICMAVHWIEQARSIAMCAPPPIDMCAPRRIVSNDECGVAESGERRATCAAFVLDFSSAFADSLDFAIL